MNGQSVQAITAPIRLIHDVCVPALIFVSLLLLPLHWAFVVIFATGYGHIGLGYWYMFHSQRQNKTALAGMGLLLLVAATLVTLYVSDHMYVRIAVGVLFSLHFLFDEFATRAESVSGPAWLTVATFLVLFNSLSVIPTFFGVPYALLIGIVALGLYGIRFFLSSKVLTSERYAMYLSVGIFFLLFTDHSVEKSLGFIILLHGYNWFVAYGERVKDDHERRRVYWRNVKIALVLSVGGYVLFALSYAPFLQYLFVPYFFFLWTIAHIFMTLRVPLFLSKR